jgi:hypothetical protein
MVICLSCGDLLIPNLVVKTCRCLRTQTVKPDSKIVYYGECIPVSSISYKNDKIKILGEEFSDVVFIKSETRL